MSDTKDLKYLLDRLKGEMGSLPREREEPLGAEPPHVAAPPPRRREGVYRPYGPPMREGMYRAYAPQEIPDRQKEKASVSSWSENKETMLFGMLSALAATAVGALQVIPYLVLAGTIVFCVFSLVAAVALLRVSLVSRNRSSSEAEHALAERLDALSRRVEMLSSKAAAEGLPSRGAAQAGEPELERKLEELRVVVKSLSKAIEGGK